MTMKTWIFLYGLLLPWAALAHSPTRLTVYLIPGHGSDYRVWQRLDLSGFDTVHLDYPILPERGERMVEYAERLLTRVDTTQPFALMGISLGGMLAVEMAQRSQPEAVIILSSARGRFDLPWLYQMQRYLPLQHVFPGEFLKQITIRLQPWYEPEVKVNQALCVDMLRQKDPRLFLRGIHMIIRWQRCTLDPSIIHLHGDRDRTLPLRAVEPPVIVLPGVTHMMTLFAAEQVDAIVRPLLSQAAARAGGR
jgi:pimeloyl-ACP methyl ester carboxylesterase